MATKVEATVRLKGGEAIAPVSEVNIDQRIDWHSTFEFSVKTEEQIDLLLKKAKEYIGKEVEIIIDSPKAKGKNDLVFKGIVTDLGFSNYLGSTHELIFRGSGPTILLEDGAMTRSFSEKKVKQIVEEVVKPMQPFLGEKKINPKLGDKLPYIVQYEESNYNFLSRLAMRYGEWFFYDGEKLVFGQLPSSSAETLEYGTNISGFDFGIKAKPASFEYKSYNYEKNDTWEVKSSEGESGGLDQNKYGKVALKASKQLYGENPLSILADVKDKGFLKKLTTGTRAALENRMVIFSGASDYPNMRPGSKITVKGLPDTKGEKEVPEYGEYLILSVSHSAGSGNYQNRFEAIPVENSLPPANQHVKMPSATPQLAIIKHNDDKDKMGRVRVQMLWQKGTSELSPWIRLSTAYAGKDRGFYLLPEKEEEVWVNFDWGDPEKPYVGGSFYHGKTKPEKWFDKDNNKKVFRTKAGNQIEIMDKSGKEEIKIFNPEEKNFISLSLDGKAQITVQTEGTLLLKAKDIELESETLAIKASKSIEMETMKMEASASQKMELATQQMKLDGGTKLEMKGMQSKLEAATAEVKASAKLDLNGGAMANLKAALVKIN